MKTKMYAALIAFMAIGGLMYSSTQAVAEPTCKGTGANCARSDDNTVYYKGVNEEVQF